MRLFLSWVMPDGATMLITLLFLLFSQSKGSPGLSLRDNTDGVKSGIICTWDRPQSAIFRDTIFIDGGFLHRRVTLDNGDTRLWINHTRILYSINLTHPFSIDDDQSQVIQQTKKPDSNMGTDLSDGFMLANDYEFITYAGYLDYIDADPTIGPTWGLARDMVQNGATPLFDPGRFRQLGLNGITRYIAAGGSVNVPSENKAFIFSGATGNNWDAFYSTATVGDQNLVAYGNSSNLISVDMSIMGSETWSNKTMPSSILPRKSAELVWVPVGQQGMLVAIGGSVNRDGDLYRTDVYEGYRTEGQQFVDNVHLYDIANDAWYTQKTFGEKLPPTAEFCTVVASSKDGKSHQIYAYGGHKDLTNLSLNITSANANVYVLSLPSFQWIKVYDGSSANHARKGHRCHKVSNNHMMVVGGMPRARSNACVDGGIVRLFNLNTLEWEGKYDPAIYDSYKVPTAVQKVIGGNETGGASLLAETWGDEAIPGLFDIQYTKSIPTYWPFPSVSGIATTLPSPTVIMFTPTSSSTNTGSGMPDYVPPLLGAILGLLGVITILCTVLFWLRRKKQQRKRLQSDSAASTVVRKRQTWNWLLGVYGDDKRGNFEDPTLKAETADQFGHSALVSPMTETSRNPIDAAVETMGQPVYEMHGDSVAQELHSSPINTGGITINNEVAQVERDPEPQLENFSSSREASNMNNASRSRWLLPDADTNTPISSTRRDEARQESNLDTRVLQRLLEDPSTSLRED